jgi:threonylcarbamoyladenosine tRNA methylthiotransferase MtaB
VRFSVITFGCRVNQADSQRIEADLCARGGVAVAPEHADVVVVNTCSVTSAADQGARQTIRRLHRLNPAARIVATGCYATREPAEVAALPGVIRVLPNGDKGYAAAAVLATEPPTAVRFGEGDGPCGAPATPALPGRTAWTLRVQTGCEERCTYCIIPATRGASRSRPLDEVVAEVDDVAAAGFKEMAVTGVHLGSYGRDLVPPMSLERLLRAIADRGGSLRFRISSLEPMDCTDAVVDLMASTPVFAPHFHLPLQHGDNRVLHAMRRPYTVEVYDRLVQRIRRVLPHAAIGSDVIAGFPGETDGDAAATLAYLERSPITHLHVFPYSDRPGTVAAALPGKVHGAAIRERADRLRSVGRRLTDDFRRAQVGTVRSGLTIEDGTLVVTDNYLKVRIPAGHARNAWVAVRVEAADPPTGEVVAGAAQGGHAA